MVEKVLVTGAAGFIGRSLVTELVSRGYGVVGLDNYKFSNQSQIPRGSHIEWVEGDTRDASLVKALLGRTDHVVHLAAPSSFIMHEENDLDACSFTMMGFKTVMEMMRSLGKKRIVWASTSAVYERHPVPYVETMVPDPPDSKAGCKHWCEMEAKRYTERYGFTAIGFRPFSVYGVGEHTKLGYANVTSLFTWAMMAGRHPVVWGDGSQTRDFIFVEDVARAFADALESDLSTINLNLGFGVEHTFNDVIRIAEQQLGFDARPQYIDVPIQIYAHRLWADMTLAREKLGFVPSVTLEEGIARIIDYTKTLPPEVRKALEVQQMYFEKLVTSR